MIMLDQLQLLADFDVDGDLYRMDPECADAAYVGARAIIAALPSMGYVHRDEIRVKPLIWQRNGNHWAGGHGFVTRKMGADYTLTQRNKFPQTFDTLDAARAAADVHHAAQVLAALDIQESNA